MSVLDSLGMADHNGIPGAADVIGLDFGLGTPSEEFINAGVNFFNGDGIGRVFNALIYTGTELRIGERKLAGARGLQSWIFGLGNEESVRDGLHGFRFNSGLASLGVLAVQQNRDDGGGKTSHHPVCFASTPPPAGGELCFSKPANPVNPGLFLFL
jgi:hypothetical protein